MHVNTYVYVCMHAHKQCQNGLKIKSEENIEKVNKYFLKEAAKQPCDLLCVESTTVDLIEALNRIAITNAYQLWEYGG